MEFSHFDKNKNAVMVDVGNKEITNRQAKATGQIHMSHECYEMVKEGRMKKGDVLLVAQTAGIMAAKKTWEIIPLCHIINLDAVKVEFEYMDDENTIKVFCTTRTDARTGVEMEALVGVNAALLTIYDMCKSVDRAMEISNIYLIDKSGGKSGHFINNNHGEHKDE